MWLVTDRTGAVGDHHVYRTHWRERRFRIPFVGLGAGFAIPDVISVSVS
jgi:hypothetical protein